MSSKMNTKINPGEKSKLRSRAARFNYRHIVCMVLLLGVYSLMFFIYPNSCVRFYQAVVDFGLSIAYFFCRIFNIPNNIIPTVTVAPGNITNGITALLPKDMDMFMVKLRMYGAALLNWETYGTYFAGMSGFLNVGFILLLVGIPGTVALKIVFKRYMRRQNNDYGKESKCLKIYKSLALKIGVPIYFWFSALINFIKEHRAYWLSALLMFLLYYNVFTIAIEAIAYYFYFIVSFNIINLYIQAYKLFCDLFLVLTIPLWVWLIVGYIVVLKWRASVGMDKLQHMELKNKGLINALPLCVLNCGVMGVGKTMMMTDVSLSQDAIFKNKAFELLLLNDLKFPNFNWQLFENWLKRCIAKHSIYNLATCKVAIERRRSYFIDRAHFYFGKKSKLQRAVWGYDYERYGLTYNNSLEVVDLFDVLKIYAQLYFIYVIQCSLIVSNYAIRTDMIMQDAGNFPLWNSDFFNRDSRLMDSYSRHSHILDFDILRLGKKLVTADKSKKFLEFGCFSITEFCKERGNQVTLQGVKKDALETNQKNDLFNYWLKMLRHGATVDNFPFIRLFGDDQRPESIDADARDVLQLVHIGKADVKRLALPLFWIEEILYYFLLPKFEQLYTEYRFNRADNTLFMYLYKKLIAKLHQYYTRIYNTYSYKEVPIALESGKLDGLVDDKVYYIMSKKIFSRRYSTDCMSDSFTALALESSAGIGDLAEFAGERASVGELDSMNAYFIRELRQLAPPVDSLKF